MTLWHRIMQGDERALKAFGIACCAALALVFLALGAAGF